MERKRSVSQSRSLTAQMRLGVAALLGLLVLQACGGGAAGGNGQPQSSTNPNGANNAAPGASAGSPAGGTYNLSGTVNGLTGSGLVLQDNTGEIVPISANGSFLFSNALPSSSTYSVTVQSQPTAKREFCAVNNGTGTIGDTNVTNIAVKCATALGFLYVSSSQPSELLSYAISSQDGTLIPSSPPLQTEVPVWGLAASPSGHLLYASNRTTDSLSIYSIDADTGSLTQVGSSVAMETGSGPLNLVISPSGKTLYVYARGKGLLITYAIDATTGALTPTGSQIPVGNSGDGIDEVITPDGKWLYVNDFFDFTVSLFKIDPETGALTQSPITAPPVGSAELSFAIDPLGQYLYLAAFTARGPAHDIDTLANVTAYSIGPGSGALSTAGAGVTFDGDGNNASSLAADPTGSYLYVLNSFSYTPADRSITALAIDRASGALKQIGLSLTIVGDPILAQCDPSGRFVYVESINAQGNEQQSSVSAYAIDSAPGSPGQLSLTGTAATDAWTLPAMAIVE